MKSIYAMTLGIFELIFLLQPANAIVSDHPNMAENLNSDYLYNLLIVFFVIACSALLVILAVHYYRIQWGRKSVLTRWIWGPQKDNLLHDGRTISVGKESLHYDIYNLKVDMQIH